VALRWIFVFGRALPAVVFTAWIFIAGTSTSGPPGPEINDKLLHALAFAVCAGSYVPAVGLLRSFREPWPNIAVASLLAVSVGAMLEICQYFLPYRTAEWADLGADSVGALLGATLVAFALRSVARFTPKRAQ
jgi:VanZ family protein